MSINIPLIGKVMGAFITTTAGALLTVQSRNENNDLTKIQIYFYDTENNNTEKTIRMPLSLPFNFSEVEIPKTGNDNSWEKLEDSGEYKEEKKKNMWKTLFDIASQYVNVQHKLNIIKDGDGIKEINNHPLKTLCQNNKCCCKDSQSSCSCEKGKCCELCLCCWAKNPTNTGECCCKNNSDDCYQDLIKSHNTFQYLRPNLNSYWTNSYLQPLQAHIKLNAKFTDLEQNNSTTSTETTQSFFGSLTYGFVDYWSKPKKYSESIPSDNNKYSTLDIGQDYYFTNVPHKFSFTYKTSTANGKSTSTSSNKDNIAEVLKAIENPEQIKKFKNNHDSQNPSVCCSNKNDTNETVKCLLSRNYVYLEKSKIDGIKDKIKGLKECCSASP